MPSNPNDDIDAGYNLCQKFLKNKPGEGRVSVSVLDLLTLIATVQRDTRKRDAETEQHAHAK